MASYHYCCRLRVVLACLTFTSFHVIANQDVHVYFGVGCFWHVQHEFIKAERTILGRSDEELTAIVGYAGATAGGPFCYKDGKVHAEVVGLIVPEASVLEFAQIYWKMFVGIDRSHANDIGPDYRAAIGIPGGMKSSLLAAVNSGQDGNVQQSFTLKEGLGDDGDTLGQPLVWVYDTEVFPFHQAELYHQFHDDYLPSGYYPASYNNLVYDAWCSGRLTKTQCSADKSSSATKITTYSCEEASGSAPPGASGGSSDQDAASTNEETFSNAHGGSGGSGFQLFQEDETSTSADPDLASCANRIALFWATACVLIQVVLASVPFRGLLP